MQPLAVLADANILVKDLVSFAFYDLANAGVIDMRWTPQIEAEYVKHRARLRSQTNARPLEASDFVWAMKRLKPIKRYLVPNYLPSGWDEGGERLDEIQADARFASLLALKDPNDVHVALAAAEWALSTQQLVMLVTENLKDLPAELLEPFGVAPLHPGDLLEVAYLANPDKVSTCLKKTAADFRNPAFTLFDMLMSVASPQQFDNKALAMRLAVRWGLAKDAQVKKALKTKQT